ncbi:hypothetical protein [Streptomyces similanensis]|uniref:Lipoprotein n=1 Tax=Streptomyces similanensis TaxID=1274988 RepID=A0ABP9KND0_9ACTN
MTKPRRTRAAAGALPAAVAVLAVLAAGCGTQSSDDDAGGAAGSARTSAAAPSGPADVPCPGESPTPTPTATGSGELPPDHYAENHGFRVPIPLHGRARCAGLAAAARIEKALRPLSERRDFDPEHTREALTALGYPAGKVESSANGDQAVSFLIDASTMCLEGSLNRVAAETDAFGGYPDGTGCEPPRGGH